jgi:polyisoprenoid-binding protein YceI
MEASPVARRRRRRPFVVIGAAVIAAVVIGLALVYFLLFPTSSPKPFSLVTSRVAVPVSAGTELGGNWTIATGSVAGYRVREKLGFLPAESDAVGRTSEITGHAALTKRGQVVTIRSASINVAVNTLKSDRAMRDQHIQTIGLQSAEYPTATFVMSAPTSLPSTALKGDVVRVPVSGVFNIHGTSRHWTVPLEMRLSNTTIQAVGSLSFPWSEFNMTAPSVAGFVNVTNKVTLEFDLHLKRA